MLFMYFNYVLSDTVKIKTWKHSLKRVYTLEYFLYQGAHKHSLKRVNTLEYSVYQGAHKALRDSGLVNFVSVEASGFTLK